MKYTDINHYRRDLINTETTIDVIEETCIEFKDNYICTYVKDTSEWYDEHGE